MSRLGLRVLMAAVGLCVIAFYLLTAGLAYYLVSTLWASRPPLATSLLLVGGLAVVIGYLNYQFGTAQLLRSLDAVEIPRREAPGLYDRVDDIAARMEIDAPRILVAEMQLPNAMALGGGREGVVVVDRSLFALLTGDELETIIAHECAHIESRDSLVQTLAYSVVRTIVGLVTVALLPILLFVTGIARGVAWMAGRPTRWDDGTLGRFRDLVSTGVVVLLVLTLLVRAHSRRREFAADARSATVTGKPVALARALIKIDRVADPSWSLLSPLYTRGDEDGPLGRVFSTHPATSERVDRLVDRVSGSTGRGDS
jgi:heat shock protein HtpX